MLVLTLVFLLQQSSGDYARGVELFERHDVDGAIEHLLRAVSASSGDAQAWKALGAAQAAKGEYALAEPPFRKACELDARLPEACYYLARTLYAENKFGPALDLLRNLLPSDPAPSRIHLAMAQALTGLDRSDEAEREFTAAIRSDGGGQERSLLAYGSFLFRQGRTAEALKPVEAAVRKFPKSAAAQLQMGRLLYQMGQPSASIAHLEQAVALDPNSAQARLLLERARRLRDEAGGYHPPSSPP